MVTKRPANSDLLACSKPSFKLPKTASAAESATKQPSSTQIKASAIKHAATSKPLRQSPTDLPKEESTGHAAPPDARTHSQPTTSPESTQSTSAAGAPDSVAQVNVHTSAVIDIVTKLAATADSEKLALHDHLRTRKSQLTAAQVTSKALQARLAERERIEQAYGVKYHWQSRLDTLKTEHDRKVQGLKEKYAEQQESKEKERKRKIAELKAKHDSVVAAKEQGWKEK